MSSDFTCILSYRLLFLSKILLELGREDEAREHMTEGRTMADTTGVKGELKMYDELLVVSCSERLRRLLL